VLGGQPGHRAVELLMGEQCRAGGRPPRRVEAEQDVQLRLQIPGPVHQAVSHLVLTGQLPGTPPDLLSEVGASLTQEALPAFGSKPQTGLPSRVRTRSWRSGSSADTVSTSNSLTCSGLDVTAACAQDRAVDDGTPSPTAGAWSPRRAVGQRELASARVQYAYVLHSLHGSKPENLATTRPAGACAPDARGRWSAPALLARVAGRSAAPRTAVWRAGSTRAW
jgi:hypothetical protein